MTTGQPVIHVTLENFQSVGPKGERAKLADGILVMPIESLREFSLFTGTGTPVERL
jgi:hypothetical protein